MNHVAAKLMLEGTTPLFTLIDTSRLPLTHNRLPCTARARSLFAGTSEERGLSEVAPYLVAVGQDAAMLDRLLEDGWGRAACVYLSSSNTYDEVFAHLAGLLKVQIEAGPVLSFRFYDPRVLRTFLPTCTASQSAEFFGPIETFWVEAADAGACFVFRREAAGVVATAVNLRRSAR